MPNQKTIFITGVSTGIGRATLEACIQNGYFVIGTVRKTVDKVVIESQFSNKCHILIFDVIDAVAMSQQIDSVKHMLADHGLAALINNAGIAVPGPLECLSEEDFEMQMDVNVKAVRRVTNALLPYLIKSKDEKKIIINISSVSGLFNSPYNGAYCISKHALESMTDVYRRELAGFGIKVVAVEPGPIKSEIWNKNLNGLKKYENSRYGSILKNANDMITASERSALPVETISDLIIKILQSNNPKTRYLVHRKKLLFKLLAYWLPDKMVDKMVTRTMAKAKSYRPV